MEVYRAIEGHRSLRLAAALFVLYLSILLSQKLNLYSKPLQLSIYSPLLCTLHCTTCLILQSEERDEIKYFASKDIRKPDIEKGLFVQPAARVGTGPG